MPLMPSFRMSFSNLHAVITSATVYNICRLLLQPGQRCLACSTIIRLADLSSDPATNLGHLDHVNPRLAAQAVQQMQ